MKCLKTPVITGSSRFEVITIRVDSIKDVGTQGYKSKPKKSKNMLAAN